MTDWTVWLGVAGAGVGVLGAVSALYRRAARRLAELQQRLMAIEASLHTAARARTTRTLTIYHQGALVRLPEGTGVRVRGWDGVRAEVAVEPWGIVTDLPCEALVEERDFG